MVAVMKIVPRRPKSLFSGSVSQQPRSAQHNYGGNESAESLEPKLGLTYIGSGVDETKEPLMLASIGAGCGINSKLRSKEELSAIDYSLIHALHGSGNRAHHTEPKDLRKRKYMYKLIVRRTNRGPSADPIDESAHDGASPSLLRSARRDFQKLAGPGQSRRP